MSLADNAAARIEVGDLVVRYGEAAAVDGVSFTVGRGEHVTLLGPSGCGKTTTLRAIAGLETPAAGTIRIAGETVYSAAERRNVPAEKRGISMVFQSYAVWPHMTVFDNVADGLRVRRLPRAEIAAAAERALDLVQMRQYAERSAPLLSGGQQQRVALARAIAFSPSVPLFDEPLSNLDQEEALAISDRVIVMNIGGIEQIGTPEVIYHRPKTRFVADFVGSANLIAGRVAGRGNGDGRIRFASAGGQMLEAWAARPPRGDEDAVAVRTAHVALSANGMARPETNSAPANTAPANSAPANSAPANSAPGSIRQRLFHGDFIQYVVDWPEGQLIVRRPPTDLFEEGAAVTLSFAPSTACCWRGKACPGGGAA